MKFKKGDRVSYIGKAKFDNRIGTVIDTEVHFTIENQQNDIKVEFDNGLILTTRKKNLIKLSLFCECGNLKRETDITCEECNETI